MNDMERNAEPRRRMPEGYRPEHDKPLKPCPQLPGTVLRVFIPAGAVVNLANLIEVTSPSGICLIVRLPILGGSKNSLESMIDSIKKAGGTVEFMDE